MNRNSNKKSSVTVLYIWNCKGESNRYYGSVLYRKCSNVVVYRKCCGLTDKYPNIYYVSARHSFLLGQLLLYYTFIQRQQIKSNLWILRLISLHGGYANMLCLNGWSNSIFHHRIIGNEWLKFHGCSIWSVRNERVTDLGSASE